MKAKKENIITSAHKENDRKRAGIFFIFGSILFFLLTTVAEAIYPNFSLQRNAISDLAAIGKNTTVIEEISILGVGTSWFLGSLYLFRNTGARVLTIMNLIPGLGLMIAGCAPENVNVAVHSVGAFLLFPVGGTVVTFSSRIILSPFKYFSMALGTISLVSTFVIFVGWRIVCGNCGYNQALSNLSLGLGGWETMIIYPLLIWLMGFGSSLLALNRREAVSSR